MQQYDIIPAPWGSLFVIFNSVGITRLCLTSEQFKREFGQALKQNKHPAVRTQLQEYFTGGRQQFTVPLVMRGTDFQTRVWETLLGIPFGHTRPYGWIAEHIGQPSASRAVGNAVGANPIPIIVPCHRVVRSDGSLGGYFYGPEMKQRLLDIERI